MKLCAFLLLCFFYKENLTWINSTPLARKYVKGEASLEEVCNHLSGCVDISTNVVIHDDQTADMELSVFADGEKMKEMATSFGSEANTDFDLSEDFLSEEECRNGVFIGGDTSVENILGVGEELPDDNYGGSSLSEYDTEVDYQHDQDTQDISCTISIKGIEIENIAELISDEATFTHNEEKGTYSFTMNTETTDEQPDFSQMNSLVNPDMMPKIEYTFDFPGEIIDHTGGTLYDREGNEIESVESASAHVIQFSTDDLTSSEHDGISVEAYDTETSNNTWMLVLTGVLVIVLFLIIAAIMIVVKKRQATPQQQQNQ